MPPALIASLYGMNFKHMPELDWGFGYPLAILLMIVAAIIPCVCSRQRSGYDLRNKAIGGSASRCVQKTCLRAVSGMAALSKSCYRRI
jgi:hypothetical protein